MDIGKEQEPFVIEPLIEPVPGREREPAPPEPDWTPAPEPVAPDRELVPA